MAALSRFIVTRNDRYAHDCKDGAAVLQDGGAPEYVYTMVEQRGVLRFLWGKRYGSKG